MSRVSIIIPVRGEQYQVSPGISVLQRTVQDIYEKATGDIEVIVVFDGEPYSDMSQYSSVATIYNKWHGTKIALNDGVKCSTGKYVMKLDAHCMLARGFDEDLQYRMEDNWVVTPRMYVLNAEEWKWQDSKFYDFFYLPCPLVDPKGFRFQAGAHWYARTLERKDIPLDENMKLHGSCWFMSKDYYINCLGGLDPYDGAGTWNGEDIEIGMKTWLGPWGGKLMVNKYTWYAHMHRGAQRPREFGVSHTETMRSSVWTANYWMKNSFEKRVHNIDWLIDKFSPVPTWPSNWRELYQKWMQDSLSIPSII